jgi:hypothetical protein
MVVYDDRRISRKEKMKGEAKGREGYEGIKGR